MRFTAQAQKMLGEAWMSLFGGGTLTYVLQLHDGSCLRQEVPGLVTATSWAPYHYPTFKRRRAWSPKRMVVYNDSGMQIGEVDFVGSLGNIKVAGREPLVLHQDGFKRGSW